MAGNHKSMACSSGPCLRVTLVPQVQYAIKAHSWLYGRWCMAMAVMHACMWTCREMSSQQHNLVLNCSEHYGHICGPGQCHSWGFRSDVDDSGARDWLTVGHSAAAFIEGCRAWQYECHVCMCMSHISCAKVRAVGGAERQIKEV